MSEAGWGTDKPTVAGVYWYRRKDMTVKILQVDEYLTVRGINIYAEHVKSCDGEWLGPITPDAYAAGRVAGLREVWEFYQEWMAEKHNGTFSVNLLNMLRRAEIEAQGGERGATI